MLTTVLTTQRLTTLCSGDGREQEGWRGASYLGRRINGNNRVLPTTPIGPSRGPVGLGPQTSNMKDIECLHSHTFFFHRDQDGLACPGLYFTFDCPRLPHLFSLQVICLAFGQLGFSWVFKDLGTA